MSNPIQYPKPMTLEEKIAFDIETYYNKKYPDCKLEKTLEKLEYYGICTRVTDERIRELLTIANGRECRLIIQAYNDNLYFQFDPYVKVKFTAPPKMVQPPQQPVTR